MSKPKPRTEYSERVRVLAPESGESLTHQSFAQHSDINYIVKRHQAGETMFNLAKKPPVYMDVHPMDYREALELARQVEERFMELPARERSRLENNPERFLAELERLQAEAETSQSAAEQQDSTRQRAPGDADASPSPNASADVTDG